MPEPIAVDVYLEKRKSKEYVGRLVRLKNQGKGSFEFIYEDIYLKGKKSIPLGPEFPLTQKKFSSKKLFASFEDRIPSKQNPAYAEYCQMQGISPDENNPLVLLGTIGRRGPSSFIFESAYAKTNLQEEILLFRKNLGISVREFAMAFDASTASIIKIEQGKGAKELMKRLGLYLNFPEAAIYEVNKNRVRLHTNTFQKIMKYLKDDNRKVKG